jgi:DNA-binding Lrp family transcriptional regulator
VSRAQRLRTLFRFSRAPKILFGVGSTLAGTVCCCMLTLVVISPPDPVQNGMSSLEMLLFVLGLIAIPAFSLFLILAALLEKRIPPRALLWSAVTLLLALAGVILMGVLVPSANERMFVTAVILLTTGVAPIVLVFSIPAVYFVARTIPDVRAVLEDDLTKRACELIGARGEMSFAELAQAVDLPLTEVDNLLDALLRSHQIRGTMYTRWQRVYTAASLAEKQRFLLEQVRAQGRVRLAELSRTLNAPPELTRDWLYQLVQRGQFTGYINWDHGWLYSAVAKHIGADSQCPNCGGQLSAGPANTIRCLYCGSEMLTQR